MVRTTVNAWLLVLTACASVACAAHSATTLARSETQTTWSNGEHGAADEATSENAGAQSCQLLGVRELARVDVPSSLGLGFGRRGGLAVFGAAGMLWGQPLSSRGEPRADPQPLLAEPDVETAVVPAAAGFAVVVRRAVRQPGACRGSCVGGPGNLPHACRSPSLRTCRTVWAWDTAVLVTDADGHLLRASSWERLGPYALAAVSAAHEGSFALATSGEEQLNVRIQPNGEVSLRLTMLPKADYLLPVRGAGPPTFLLLNEAGPLLLSDARGAHEIGGQRLSVAGRLLNARPAARWGEGGKLHLAWREWLEAPHALRYSVVQPTGTLTLEVSPTTSDARSGFEPPFALYVEPHRLTDGNYQRTTWLHEALGEKLALSDLEPSIRELSVRHDFSGDHFVFAYVSSDRLRTIAADCRGR